MKRRPEIIQLTKGIVALVDAKDYPKLSKDKWCAAKAGTRWVATRTEFIDGKWQPVLMHRRIMGDPVGKDIDHRKHYPRFIDNRRSNLRLVTVSQNQMNKRKTKNYTSSKYKGVSWFKPQKIWKAQIKLDGQSTFLGYFKTEIEAARAYDFAAKELFGDFACVNFS